MPFDYLARIESLSPAALTVREQARLAQNPNELRWRDIFPRTDADDISINSLTAADYRPAADFREWNADGREIPEVLGPRVTAEMVPISATHHIDERRLQKLRQANPRISQLVTDGVIADVNTWPTKLADAVDRAIEKAAFQVWATNSFTVMDPKTGSTITLARGVSASRYVTEGTAWATVANSYDRLLFHLGEAQRLMGSVGVVRLRRATWAEVVKDAPAGPNALRPTVANVADRLSEEGFGTITVVIDERAHDAFTDGGSVTAATNYIPTGKVLFQPAGGGVGNTHFAAVTRAYDYVAQDQRANLRDVVILHMPVNDGKTYKLEAEAIALPLTNEQTTYVVDAIT